MNFNITAKPRIMLVEDEAVIRYHLQECLEELDYTVVETADTGEEAVEKALNIKPDLIFMDIKLAGKIDGIEAARKISSSLSVPIIFLTAYSDESTQERVLQSSPYGYLLKPFDERILKTKIEIALQRHYYERELDKSRNWYANTLKSIGDAVLTTDKSGAITFLNPVAEKILGISQAQAVGESSLELLNFISEENRQPIENPVTVALEQNETVYLPRNTTLVKKDGSETPVEDCASLIWDEQAGALGVVVVFRDASLQRQINEQIQQAQKLQAVGTLTAGVAHNFNNLMTGVMGNLELGLMQIKNVDLDKLKLENRLQNALSGVMRAAALTRKMMMFARIDFINPQLHSLNKLIAGMNNLFELVGRQNTTLQIDLAATEDSLMIDVVHLEQAVLNLVINSLDALPQGGQISVFTENRDYSGQTIDAAGSLIPGGQYLVVGVRDNGAGMSEEVCQNIFVPFFTTKTTSGTGLGLPSVLGFVRQSQGFIEVQSKPSQGTEIKMIFPIARHNDSQSVL